MLRIHFVSLKQTQTSIQSIAFHRELVDATVNNHNPSCLSVLSVFSWTTFLETAVYPLSWLDSSIGRELHWYRRGHGFESHFFFLIFFFRLHFRNRLSCVYNCSILNAKYVKRELCEGKLSIIEQKS